MVRADVHVHSTCSFDGLDAMQAMCKKAAEIGLTTVCFAEHHDYAPDHFLDVARYREEIERARAAFPGLRVLRGIEAGYADGHAAQLTQVIQSIEPDFVLLSCHSVEGVDPYDAAKYFARRSREEGSRAYLEALLRAMEGIPDFDALAHIGYASRYAPPGEEATPLLYGDAPDLIEAIFRELIARDKALEVNTGRTIRGGALIPGEDCLARYYEMGGRLLTLGSDAHAVDGLAAGFAQTRDLLLRIGFTHHAVYAGRAREDWAL